MAHFTLDQDFHHEDSFDFSDINIASSHKTHNNNFHWPSCDLTGSPQSTLWSPIQGSPEGSSQEPSPPATPGNNQDSYWNSTTTYDMVGGIDRKIKLNDTLGNSKNNPDYKNQNQSSNIGVGGVCSYQTLIQEQIRAIELCRRLKQEQNLFPQNSPTVRYPKIEEGQISSKQQYYGSKQEIQQYFQKRGKGSSNNGRRRSPPPPTLQTGSCMRAVFLGGSGSRSSGTGVFLPRGAPESTKQGKGCSAVLVPARVVQALQLHFDKAVTTMSSEPKVVGFPPLRDLVVSDREGMYSLLQNRQSSTQAPADVQNEMILPREWTY